jgi:hypothetical protein
VNWFSLTGRAGQETADRPACCGGRSGPWDVCVNPVPLMRGAAATKFGAAALLAQAGGRPCPGPSRPMIVSERCRTCWSSSAVSWLWSGLTARLWRSPGEASPGLVRRVATVARNLFEIDLGGRHSRAALVGLTIRRSRDRTCGVMRGPERGQRRRVGGQNEGEAFRGEPGTGGVQAHAQLGPADGVDGQPLQGACVHFILST